MTPREQSAARVAAQRAAGRAFPLTPQEYAERRRRYLRESTSINPRQAAHGVLIGALAFLSPLAVLVWAGHAGWSRTTVILVELPLVCLPIVYVFAGFVATHTRPEAVAKRLGLICPRCGLPFVGVGRSVASLQADEGRCRGCRAVVIAAAEPAVVRDEAAEPQLTRTEYVARVDELNRAGNMDWLVAGVVFFGTLGGLALLLLPERQPPILSDGAAVAVILCVFLFVFVGTMVVMSGRWWERVHRLGLRCGVCHELLVGGRYYDHTDETLETGMCSECGNRVFRDEE